MGHLLYERILEWEKEMNCYLCGNGQRSAALTLDATLQEMVTTALTAEERRKLHQLNTLIIGEVIHDANRETRWSLPQQLRWLQTKLPDQPPEDRRYYDQESSCELSPRILHLEAGVSAKYYMSRMINSSFF